MAHIKAYIPTLIRGILIKVIKTFEILEKVLYNVMVTKIVR